MVQQQLHHGGPEPDDHFDDHNSAGQEQLMKLSHDTDDLLDEIDSVLEENAEDFVQSYVQKGGQ